MIVTWLEIAQVAYAAGFRSEALRDAICLTQPESERKSDAFNPEDPNGGSFGLWQINGIHDPNATGTPPNMVPSQAWIDKMFTPAENAKAAFRVWSNNGKSFNPWSTFKNGLHEPWKPVAVAIMYAREQLANCQSNVAGRDARISVLESSVTTLQAAVEERDQRVEDLTNRVSMLTDEKQAAQNEVDRLNGVIDQAVEILT